MTSKEFEFYLRADLSQYKGKYVAIVEDKVVASGENAKEVFEEAKRKTGKIPTIAKIPKDETFIFQHYPRLSQLQQSPSLKFSSSSLF